MSKKEEVSETKTEDKKKVVNNTTKKEKVKTSNPIVPIGLGIVDVSAIGSIFYFNNKKKQG